MDLDADDMFVVIVGDGDSKELDISSLNEPIQVDNILKTAVKHGEFVEVNVKEEPDDIFESVYIKELDTSENEICIKTEWVSTETDNDNSNLDNNEEYYLPRKRESPDNETHTASKQSKSYRRTMLTPSEYKSHIEDLRNKFPTLRKNLDLLITTVADMMRNLKIPEPPKYFYREEGSKKICSFCDGVTTTLPAAARHYQERHGPRYLVCYACGFDFKSTSILYKHEIRCRAPDAYIVRKARVMSMGNKARTRPFVQFYTRQKLTSFPCDKCSAIFTSKSTLESHENLHKGERPYQCQHCPNAYTAQYALARHLKQHSNIDYICDYCGKSFKIKSLLVSHMETHSKLKKFACEYCGKRFRQRGALNHHVNTFHKRLPPPCVCQICGRRYPRMSLLKVHMNNAHGLLLMTREMFVKALPTMSEIQVKQAAKVVLKSEVEKMQPKEDEDQTIWEVSI